MTLPSCGFLAISSLLFPRFPSLSSSALFAIFSTSSETLACSHQRFTWHRKVFNQKFPVSIFENSGQSREDRTSYKEVCIAKFVCENFTMWCKRKELADLEDKIEARCTLEARQPGGKKRDTKEIKMKVPLFVVYSCCGTISGRTERRIGAETPGVMGAGRQGDESRSGPLVGYR